MNDPLAVPDPCGKQWLAMCLYETFPLCMGVKPESTEGGRRVSVLKRQEGAPANLG